MSFVKPAHSLPPTETSRLAKAVVGDGGKAIVEFALVAPAFLGITLSIFEFSGIMFVQTLLEGGHTEDVIRQRMAFQQVMRHRFEHVVEAATGRKVVGFMSGNHQDPDMICEVFILAPNDIAN